MQDVVGGNGIAARRIDPHNHALDRRIVLRLLEQFDKTRSGEAFVVGGLVAGASRYHSLSHDQRDPAAASG